MTKNDYRYLKHNTHKKMPRRPRPAHRAPPGQGRKPSHRVPLPPPKSKMVFKAQLLDPKSKISKVAREEESSFKEAREDDKLGTPNILKRRREEEEQDEEEEEDTETDADADADTPRVVQWLDDDDILLGRSWEDELKQKAPDEVHFHYFPS